MKKLLMFLCCVCLVGNAFGESDRDCPAKQQITLDGIQNGNDNEFIYTSKAVYDEVRECNKNKKIDGTKCNISKGEVYECDTESGCKGGTHLLAESGWVIGKFNWSTAVDVSNKILRCNVLGDDSWSKYDYTDCPDGVGSKTDGVKNDMWEKITFENSKAKECYYNQCASTQDRSCIEGYCCVNAGKPKNSDEDACRKQGGAWKNGTCICKDGTEWVNKKCNNESSLQKCLNERKGNKEGMACCYLSKNEAEFTGGKCICKNNREFSIGADGRGQCKAPKEIPDELQKCLNERKGNDVGTACCYLQEKNEAEFTGSKCVCKNGGEFSVGDGHGQCKVKDDDSGMPFDCPEINLSADSSCPDAVRAIADLKVYCADAGRTKDGYEARVNTVNTFIQLCKDQKTAAENDDLKDKAKQLEEQISSKLSGWRETLTVWKTAEGNFNGARLASDSIAGVVLGTAGGLITSSVVKKNQVKSGFEDIQCTVGGQKVADWHDEFTVGIQ